MILVGVTEFPLKNICYGLVGRPQILSCSFLTEIPRGKRSTLKKREVLDIVFEIYKPEGTGIKNDRRSTWLHPIIDGEDAMKLLGELPNNTAHLCLSNTQEVSERHQRSQASSSDGGHLMNVILRLFSAVFYSVLTSKVFQLYTFSNRFLI